MLLGITPSCSSNNEALLHKREASPNDKSADSATSTGPLITMSLIDLKPDSLSFSFKLSFHLFLLAFQYLIQASAFI
jgi:hypothetical protein